MGFQSEEILFLINKKIYFNNRAMFEEDKELIYINNYLKCILNSSLHIFNPLRGKIKSRKMYIAPTPSPPPFLSFLCKLFAKYNLRLQLEETANCQMQMSLKARKMSNRKLATRISKAGKISNLRRSFWE